MGAYELSKSLLVFYGGDDGWQLVFRDDEGRFHPILELLVPSILPEIVYDATYQFTSLSVHPHEQ